MNYEEMLRDYFKYVEYIIEKTQKYRQKSGKPVAFDYDFLELSNYDFNRALFYVNCMQHFKKALFDPTYIFKDNPEMLLTYYLIEGKKLFIDVDEEHFVVANFEVEISSDNLDNDERMKRLYKAVCDNKDLKDQVIHNTINYFIEYADQLLGDNSFNPAKTECINSIYNLLQSEDVSFDDSKYLYENLVCKYSQFKSINYDELIQHKPLFLSIPGFIDNISANGFMDYFSMIYESQDDVQDEFICEIIKNIYDSNKERPDSIHHLNTLIREIDTGKELEGQLISFYPELEEVFGQDDKTLVEAKAIYEGKNIDIANPVDLSKNEFFRDNLDQMIRSYINNGTSNEDISLAILLALAQNLKDSKGLEYNVVVNTSAVDANTLGYYDDDKRVLYINPSYVKPGKENFIKNVSTIIHEVQHAVQYQQLFEGDDYSYNTLAMITDSIVSKTLFSPYYKENYQNIAYEIDARSSQLFETLKFIDEYCPEMRETFKENFLYNLTDTRVRKDYYFYKTSLQMFLEKEESAGAVRKAYIEGEDKTKEEKEYTLREIEKYKKMFLKFPVFEYDEEEYVFKLKSEKEIEEIKKHYEEVHDEVGLDLVNNVLYDIKLAKFLEGKVYNSLDEAVEKVREGFGGK